MSTRNKRKIQKIDENVMRRKLLRMDTKTLMKHCKSKNIKHYGSRGEIVNRLIKKSKNNTKQNKNNRKTKKKKVKRSTPSIHIVQSSTEEIGSINIVITPKKKHKSTNKTQKKIVKHKKKQKSKIISYCQLKLIINGYIRKFIMHNSVYVTIPDQINNICVNYSSDDIYDLNNLDLNLNCSNAMVRTVNDMYLKQCKYTLGTLYSFVDMKTFVFGICNNFPQFLQYLSDCYIKKMAQKRKNPFSEESIIIYLRGLKWMKNVIKINPNLFSCFVKDLTLYIHAKTNKNNIFSTHKTYGMITNAMRIDAYFDRNIYDDIYAIFYYISTCIKFINNLIDTHKNITPFQFDFCILFKQLKQTISPNSLFNYDNDMYFNDQYDSNDSSDNSDIEYDYHSFMPKFKKEKTPKLNHNKLDVVGDIKYRLKTTNCMFAKKDIDTNFNYNSQDINFEQQLLCDFHNTYNNFLQKTNVSDSYPRNHRFIGVVDRRKYIKNEERNDGYDELIIFEPPKSKKCNKLEIDNKLYHKPLPESYHNKSVQCLIPGIGFNICDYNMANNENELTGNVRETINCVSNLNGGMMTLSYHIESDNQMKCYLWYGNGYLRFYPKDVQNILSLAFMLDYKDNAYFLNDSLISKKMNKLNMKDRHFEYFYETMTGKKFKHFCK